MRLSLIDFNVHDEGLYTNIEECEELELLVHRLGPGRIIVTDPDLEAYCTLVPESMLHGYGCTYTPDLVLSGLLSTDVLTTEKHNILIGNNWELTARMKKVTPEYFILHVGNDLIYTQQFVLGQPI